MGEKGNVVGGVAAAAPTAASGLLQEGFGAVADTTVSVVGDTAEAVRGAALGAVAGAAVDQAAERLRHRDEDAEDDAGPTSG